MEQVQLNCPKQYAEILPDTVRYYVLPDTARYYDHVNHLR
jgi:hypothetical protein